MKTKKFKVDDQVITPNGTKVIIVRITRNTWGRTMYVADNKKRYFAENLTKNQS